MTDLPNRRPCVTEDIGMGLSVTVSYHPQTGQPCEVFLTGRGKASDNPMQDALYNLGVTASNLMQPRYKLQVIRAKKGRGSYQRKGRTERPLRFFMPTCAA